MLAHLGPLLGRYRFSFLTKVICYTYINYLHIFNTFFCYFSTLRPSYFRCFSFWSKCFFKPTLGRYFRSNVHFWPFQQPLFEKIVYISDKSASLNLDFFNALKKMFLTLRTSLFFHLLKFPMLFFATIFQRSILTFFQLLYRHFCNTFFQTCFLTLGTSFFLQFFDVFD